MGTVRTIKIEESVFADNTSSAEAIRRMLTDKKTTMLNFMSSPGSGKTTLLTALVNKLKDELTISRHWMPSALRTPRALKPCRSITAACATSTLTW